MPRPTRRAFLTAPGLSESLFRDRKVMGSPRGWLLFCGARDENVLFFCIDSWDRPELKSATDDEDAATGRVEESRLSHETDPMDDKGRAAIKETADDGRLDVNFVDVMAARVMHRMAREADPGSTMIERRSS